jgi:hypothetical protein
MIIGKITLLRSDENFVTYNVCDNKRDEDHEFSVFHMDTPIITAAIKAEQDGISSFELHKYSYEILEFKLKLSSVKNATQSIPLDINAVIHLTSSRSFNEIRFHCPSCRSNGKDVTEIVSVLLEKLSNQNEQIGFDGVLHCKKCGYFYADKHLFNIFLKDNLYDVAAPRKEIQIRDNKIHYPSSWNGAPDSILSRYGYTADGSLPQKTRRRVVSYVVGSKKASVQEVQNLLAGFLRGRELRNPKAALIWKSDLEWLNKEFGTGKIYQGIISQF